MNHPGATRILVRGELGPDWSAWFGDLSIRTSRDGLTVIEGVLADQAALHGVLSRLRNLGLELLTVSWVDQVNPVTEPGEKDAGQGVH